MERKKESSFRKKNSTMAKIRFILWGTILTAWIFVRIFRTMGGEVDDLNSIGFFVGLVFKIGLPIGIVFEIVYWARKRKK